VNITETDPQMVLRRQRLIRELRSGSYLKGTGKLVTIPERYNREVRGYVADYENPCYCCIGLGCSLLGFPARLLQLEHDRFYSGFMLDYGITDKQKYYLMGMNDGNSVKWSEDSKHQGSYMTNAPRIRSGDAPDREFPFIARFLEIMWGMSENR
jgi:hypothetical protein